MNRINPQGIFEGIEEMAVDAQHILGNNGNLVDVLMLAEDIKYDASRLVKYFESLCEWDDEHERYVPKGSA